MATGFSNDAGNTSSEYRSYSSWGRTRQPKTLTTGQGTAITLPTTAAPTVVGDGYTSQNQRFLHVTFYRSQASARTLYVWLYSHAFGKWSQLKIGATAQSLAANNTTTSAIFEINGADKVYIQSSGALHANDRIYLACSTF